MSIRELQAVIPGRAASDGAGVKLKRSLGSGPGARVDPFLMLDEFRSDDANDYIAGFPPHPHRGFETVTYMLDGRMRHEDHLGNSGLLESGGVQWMTAGRGIIHSEMPEQEDGLMHGFQLWINLPAAEKMKPASYRDIPAAEIPSISGDGWTGKLVAGELEGTVGAVHGITTDPLYLDLHLDADRTLDLPVADERNAFIYVYDGAVTLAAAGGQREIAAGNAGVFGKGDSLRFTAGGDGVKMLVLAAKPLREPIEQYGPFVMNTREEIEQAMRDYSAGRLAG